MIAWEPVSVPEPFRAVILRVPGFPVDREQAATLAALLGQWLDAYADRLRLQPAIWMQGAALHHHETVELLSEHAREWMPELGLGVRPCGEPPRMLNQDDLDQLKWDQMPRPKHETLFLLSGGTAVARTALPLLCGSGTMLYGLLESNAGQYLAEQQAQWLPEIQDPAFRAHAFYVPLFDGRCLETATSAQLFTWIGRAVVYVRESLEDSGILVLSSHALAIEMLDRQMQLWGRAADTSGAGEFLQKN